MKLSYAQVEMLTHASRHAGGARVRGAGPMRTARALAKAGLVELKEVSGTLWSSRALITTAGEQALKEAR